MNYFEALELPESLSLDPKDLENRFYAQSRKWHPDRFARASAAEQQTALDTSAVLNDAYRTLRDPAARAVYVLKLHGIDVGEGSKQEVPPELLEEVFELNMTLEELKMGDTDALPQLRAAKDKFLTMMTTMYTELEGLFDKWDKSHNAATLAAIKSLLQRRKYIANLVRETEKTLENHVSD